MLVGDIESLLEAREHRMSVRSATGEAAHLRRDLSGSSTLGLVQGSRCEPLEVLLSVLACAFALALDVASQPALRGRGRAAVAGRHLRALCGAFQVGSSEAQEMGMSATVQRRVEEQTASLEMLEMVAVANHKAKRRSFQARKKSIGGRNGPGE